MTQTVLLGDVCEYITEKVLVEKIDLVDYVSTENLLPDKNGLVVAEKLPQAGKVTEFRLGDVLVSNIRPYFKKIWYADRGGGASNDVLVFRPKRDDILNNYLYYILKNDKFFNFSTASSGGSKMPRGDKVQLMKYPLILPSLSAQKKVADILGSLDEKIEMNRRMNETLEQMGQALFRHYFIDNPEAEEWEVIKLGDKVTPRRGKSLQSRDMRQGAIPVVSGGLNPAGTHDESNTTAPVVTVSASGANAGYTALWGENVWSADSSFIDSTITPNVYFYYIFMSLNQKRLYEMQTGSGQPHIYPKHIELLEMPNAPNELILEFNNEVAPYFEKLEENKKQTQTLTTLRDTLLPKLISGEIEV